MLEFDDIQHILLTRTPAITGRYEFLSFDTPAGGRAWVAELLEKVQSAADVQATMFIPNNLERDTAIRLPGPDGQIGDSVSEVAPVAVFGGELVIEGVY